MLERAPLVLVSCIPNIRDVDGQALDNHVVIPLWLDDGRLGGCVLLAVPDGLDIVLLGITDDNQPDVLAHCSSSVSLHLSNLSTGFAGTGDRPALSHRPAGLATHPSLRTSLPRPS